MDLQGLLGVMTHLLPAQVHVRLPGAPVAHGKEAWMRGNCPQVGPVSTSAEGHCFCHYCHYCFQCHHYYFIVARPQCYFVLL